LPASGRWSPALDARHFEADLDAVREGEDERSLDFAAFAR
jgi:hypothetical protein